MDNATRGQIENSIDEGIRKLSLKSSAQSIVNWVMTDIADFIKDATHETSSAEDLAVGYVLGYLSRVAHQIILDSLYKQQQSIQSALTASRNKPPDKDGVKTLIIRASVSKTETEEVRRMLQARLPIIREKINRALNV